MIRLGKTGLDLIRDECLLKTNKLHIQLTSVASDETDDSSYYSDGDPTDGDGNWNDNYGDWWRDDGYDDDAPNTDEW
ncbi:MAG: hypothetical protein KA807_18920 [Prolixibacteraceae bacterium]|jgi:fructose-1,6-bisphosphatase|nr:hypothetical protein [Prolixibacteraceae bacterium]OQC12600.1 MAG: hypothetical protein BWX72_01929 [Firmicutes bacterium ADurb.Bin080]